MIKSLVSMAFAIAISLLAGCVVAPIPQQTYGNSSPAAPGSGYVAPVSQPVSPVASGGHGTFCNIDGVVTHEVNGAACVAKAEAKAKTLVSGKSVDVKHQPNQPTCKPDSSWTKLNWPGHPQHNGYVCLPDGDSHRFKE